ncbi:TPA: AAA domain-containing protein, partial [Streptococcus suis]
FVNFLDNNAISKAEILSIFQKRLYSVLLDKNRPLEYSTFSKHSHINTVNRFKELDRQSMELARKRVYNQLVYNLPNLDSIEYIDEVRILKKEFNKKARFLPTRKLIEKLPTLLPKFKPCIMMSPLTVSTYFGTNTEWEFDLVIFDEASQVKPEYAIGSIARGKQLIVAGDSKQMPPTSFFSATNVDEEQLDDSQEDLVELESVLDELAVVLPETHLDWHYRSKDESLITFSNIKFYNNRLLTFPSENIDKEDSIQFTHVPDGVWESRNGNKPEADKVLESIIWYADHFPNKSLGVVAFGKSQSTQIEERLEKFLEQNPKYHSYFDENKSEPFFIKNLENVQGDERDIIIISVGYGRRPDGKLIMNFGPLTKSGGERRLNVAASRAREKMHIVSSIKGSDIRVDDTSNENRHILRDFLDYAELGREVLVGYDTNIVDRELHFDSDFEENVYDFLVREGYTVHTQVGDSGYKIDLAIVHPNSSGRYLLAIECDGRAYHSSKTARDRDRLRQEILEGKGWKFYRIWSSNWLYDNNNEKNSIRDAIQEAISESEKSNKLSDIVTYDEERVQTILEYESVESNQFELSKYAVVLNDLHANEEDEKDNNSHIEDNSERNNLDLEILKENHVVQDLEFFSSHEHDLEGICSVLLQHAKRFRGQLVGDWLRYVNEQHFGRKRLTTFNENIYKKALLH